MVTVSGKMIQTLLVILVFLFVLGIITPLINWSMNEDFRCRASVWLTANNVGPGLACEPNPVTPSDRDLNRENGAARIVADEMLACHTLFNAGGSNTILDYRPIVPHIGAGVDTPISIGGTLSRGQFSGRNYCFVCAVVNFEDDDSMINDFDRFLTTERKFDQTYYTSLYGSTPLRDRYLQYLDGSLEGDVWIIYSEGNAHIPGSPTGVSSGVVALDRVLMESDQDPHPLEYLCSREVSLA